MGEGASKLIILPRSYYCCSLRLGAKIIASLDLIAGVISIFLIIVMISMPNKTKNMGITEKLLYFSLAAAFLSFLGAGILLIGIVQYRRWFFIPYFIFSPISMVLNLIALAMSVPEVPVYVAVPLGMLTILGVYNWLIVLSYFGVLQDGEDEGTGTDSETEY